MNKLTIDTTINPIRGKTNVNVIIFRKYQNPKMGLNICKICILQIPAKRIKMRRKNLRINPAFTEEVSI